MTSSAMANNEFGPSGQSTSTPDAATLSARLWHDPQIRLWRLPALRILPPGILVADRTGDDHILALLPVHRRRDSVLCGQLHGIDHPQHLVEVSTGVHGIDENELDPLV